MCFRLSNHSLPMTFLYQIGLLYALLHAQTVSDTAFADIVVTGVKSGIERTSTTEYTIVLDSLDFKVVNASNAADLLGSIQGFSLTNRMGNNQLRINGLSGTYTKFLVDGVPIASGEQAFGFNLEQIPVNDIERIEIVKGSTSVLYGSDAIGGVVNIIRKKSTGIPTASIELRQRYASNIGSSQWKRPGFSSIEPRDGIFSTWGGAFNGSIAGSHDNRWFGVRADAGYYYDAGAVDTITKRPQSVFGDRPYYSMPRDRRRNIRIDLTTDKALPTSVKASLNTGDNVRESSVADNQKLTQKMSRYDGNIRLEHEVSKQVMLAGYATAQRQRDERERYNFDNKAVSEQERTDFPTVEGEALAFVDVGMFQRLTLGINGMYEVIEAPYIAGGRKSGNQLAAFIQDIIRFGTGNLFVITPGLRYTHNSRFTGALTPSLGARANVSPGLFFRTGAGAGYKAPTFKSNYRDEWVHTGGIFVLSGNPDLEPERSWNLNGGIGGKIGDVLSWETGAHGTKLIDQIATRETSKDTGTTARGERYSAVRQYVNNDSAYTRGVDISLEITPVTKMRIKASYSFLQSKFWNPEGVLTESELYSPHTIKVSAYYKPAIFNGYLPSVMTSVIWESAQKYLASATGELRSITDISAALELPILSLGSLTIGGKNILDNDDKEWNKATGRTLFAELKISIADITRPFNVSSEKFVGEFRQRKFTELMI